MQLLTLLIHRSTCVLFLQPLSNPCLFFTHSFCLLFFPLFSMTCHVSEGRTNFTFDPVFHTFSFFPSSSFSLFIFACVQLCSTHFNLFVHPFLSLETFVGDFFSCSSFVTFFLLFYTFTSSFLYFF